MRFFHLSDMHIGKRLNGYSLQENQEQVLGQIVNYARERHPDAILICGDIYDKTAPSGEAYTLFGWFLEELSRIRPRIPVLIIAGNHDSPERLAYAGSFLEKHRIYLSVMPPSGPEEHLKQIVLEDEEGEVTFWMLPFLKPGYVRRLAEGKEPLSWEGAVRLVLEREQIDFSKRNVILSHQFYAGEGRNPETCDSEQAVLLAGGLDQVPASLLEKFDYAALGHLHGAQQAGKPWIRYCGTPYKYSVSEQYHQKAVLEVTLGAKGEPVTWESLPLCGVQDVRAIRGTLEELLDRAGGKICRDFVSVTVTGEEELYHVREKLEEVYPFLLDFRVENSRMRQALQGEEEPLPVQSPLETFGQFYEAVTGQELTAEQETWMEQTVDAVKEERR